jgi:hypothetical protein
MTDTEIQIQLDSKHLAHRSQNNWAIQRRQPDGSYDLVANWTGGRRSLLQWCDANDVHPTRDAEALLAKLPEANGFRERG